MQLLGKSFYFFMSSSRSLGIVPCVALFNCSNTDEHPSGYPINWTITFQAKDWAKANTIIFFIPALKGGAIDRISLCHRLDDVI